MTETTPKTLDLQTLHQIVNGDAAALRAVTRMQPAGGKGDKVFPPTYEGGKYAAESRVVDGKQVNCVLLDSVQSQANRMEIALLEASRAGQVSVPVVEVDFGADVPEVGRISSLEAPHRLADAILRDSSLDGKPFRDTEPGKALHTASAANATGLFRFCPTALVFGVWDSTGPRGGLGTKFQRALVSELTAVNVAMGRRTSSRIDPLGIQVNAGVLYKTTGGWTLDPEQALKEKGQPVKLGKDGKPSEANHGNVTPALADGGVTFDHALRTTVLSLPALRRLRFPVHGAANPAADEAARTCLAALGLCAAVLMVAKGCDLRSRCLLVPEPGQAAWQAVNGDGSTTDFTLDAKAATALLKAAVQAAATAGLAWTDKPVILNPNAGLVTLVKKSRELATQSTAEG